MTGNMFITLTAGSLLGRGLAAAAAVAAVAAVAAAAVAVWRNLEMDHSWTKKE